MQSNMQMTQAAISALAAGSPDGSLGKPGNFTGEVDSKLPTRFQGMGFAHLAILSMLLYTAKAEDDELATTDQLDTYHYYPDKWDIDIIWWFIKMMVFSYALGVLTGGCVVKLCYRANTRVPMPIDMATPLIAQPAPDRAAALQASPARAPDLQSASESVRKRTTTAANTRTVGVQGPATYPWWHKQPRYSPLPDRRWGAWWEA